MGGRLLGYARVSVADQRLDLQLDALRAAGVPDHLTFTDHGVSGARAQRPGLNRLLEEARDGDTVVCWRLDRLGRSLVNLSTLASTLADWEREVIRERVIAGVHAARRAGKVLGRKPRLLPHQIEDARRMRDGGFTYGQIARHYNLDRAVVWRAVNGGRR